MGFDAVLSVAALAVACIWSAQVQSKSDLHFDKFSSFLVSVNSVNIGKNRPAPSPFGGVKVYPSE